MYIGVNVSVTLNLLKLTKCPSAGVYCLGGYRI